MRTLPGDSLAFSASLLFGSGKTVASESLLVTEGEISALCSLK